MFENIMETDKNNKIKPIFCKIDLLNTSKISCIPSNTME